MSISESDLSQVPDSRGRFGRFGGRYVPGTLTRDLEQLELEYRQALKTYSFHAELAETFA